MKKIKAIIFDFGGVILNIDYNRTKQEFLKLGIKNIDNFYSQKKQTNIFNLIEKGKITEKDFLKQIKKQTKDSTLNQIICAWNSMLLDLPKERLNLIASLKKKYQIYLLSNTNVIHIEYLTKILSQDSWKEFYNLFDKIYFSYEIGMRKPDFEIFEYVLRKEKLTSREVLFIDDSPQHIEAAKKLGIHAYCLCEGEDVIDLFPDIVQ